MKKLKLLTALAIVSFMLFTSCKKDDNRRYGVCYCEFVKGDDQEYDLTQFSRQEQIDKCNTHDSNAALFGGGCELE